MQLRCDASEGWLSSSQSTRPPTAAAAPAAPPLCTSTEPQSASRALCCGAAASCGASCASSSCTACRTRRGRRQPGGCSLGVRLTPRPSRQPPQGRKHCCVRTPGWSRDQRCDAQAGAPALAARRPFCLRSSPENSNTALWASHSGVCRPVGCTRRGMLFGAGPLPSQHNSSGPKCRSWLRCDHFVPTLQPGVPCLIRGLARHTGLPGANAAHRLPSAHLSART